MFRLSFEQMKLNWAHCVELVDLAVVVVSRH